MGGGWGSVGGWVSEGGGGVGGCVGVCACVNRWWWYRVVGWVLMRFCYIFSSRYERYLTTNMDDTVVTTSGSEKNGFESC